MTRRFLVILAVGLLCGLASSWIAYRSCCDRPLVTAAASGDVRAWFRAEFGLDEATIDAIQQSQERFRPECEIHCRDIRDARVALMTLPPDAPDDVRKTALDLLVKRTAFCQSERIAQAHRIAALMPPEAGRRYLSMVLPRIEVLDHSGAPDATGKR